MSSFYFKVTDSAQERTNLLNFLISTVANSQGANGVDGEDGKSAYEIAISLGYIGTQEQWIESLNGSDGTDGLSAYQIAVSLGYIGTESQWIASLKGTNGINGIDGKSITAVLSSKVGKTTTVRTYIDGVLANEFQVLDGADGGGSGDMLKSVYDTTGNGVVDVAESVEWSGVTGKPTIGDMLKATYDTDLDGKVDTAEVADLALSVDWDNVQNKPTVFGGDMTKAVYDTTNNGKVDIAEKVHFDISNTIQPQSAGQLAWNIDDSTVDINLGGGVILQTGQEFLVPVINNTASIITNMTVCMYTGSVGNSGKITIAPMDGTVQSNANKIIGVATQNIAVGGSGFVTTMGRIRGVDTSLLTEQLPIYVSTTIIGGLTTTQPTTGMKLKVGSVVTSHTNGSLNIRITILDENAYQPMLVSGTNIKTINNTSILGSGNIDISSSGGATGGGTDKIFNLNGQVITTNYTIPVGQNAVSAGNITINTGVTVTVPTGSKWVIV